MISELFNFLIIWRQEVIDFQIHVRKVYEEMTLIRMRGSSEQNGWGGHLTQTYLNDSGEEDLRAVSLDTTEA